MDPRAKGECGAAVSSEDRRDALLQVGTDGAHISGGMIQEGSISSGT